MLFDFTNPLTIVLACVIGTLGTAFVVVMLMAIRRDMQATNARTRYDITVEDIEQQAGTA